MEGNVEPVLLPPQSHLSQVPNEILAKIFAAGTEAWRELYPQGFPFPYLVSGVCKHWRILSHNTPALWTFILPPLHKDPEESLMWTSEWIKRSSAMSISVVLDDTLRVSKSEGVDERSMNQHTLMLGIFGLLAQCAHRLYRIDIRIETITSNIIKSLATISMSNPHLLQQISICSHSGQPRYVGFASSGKYSWLQTLPNLTKFRFQGSSFWPLTMPGMGNSLSLPYISNLTTLHLSHLRLTHSDLEIIFATPDCRLRHLVLRHLYPILSPTPDGFSPIRVESLQSIAVSSGEKTRGDQGVYLFCLLVMPNLSYLEIDSDIRISVLFGNSISASKIETLKIINRLPISLAQQFPDKRKEDLQVFRAFSSMQNLDLIRLGVPAKVLLSSTISENTSGMTRKRSINFRKRGLGDTQQNPIEDPSQSVIAWPNLRSVALDTMFADDVKSLIDYMKHHKSIQTVHLSASAMRNLSSLRRKGDNIILPLPGLYTYRAGMHSTDEGVTDDVPEWLNKQVKLQTGLSVNKPLLEEDAEGHPLSEML